MIIELVRIKLYLCVCVCVCVCVHVPYLLYMFFHHQINSAVGPNHWAYDCGYGTLQIKQAVISQQMTMTMEHYKLNNL